MIGFQQFSHYTDEIKFLINHGFNIPRKDMPQIKDHNRGSFLQYLTDNGISYENKNILVKDYKISQGEIDIPKVLGIVSKGSPENYPIIVSNDGFIADGHHRFVAKYVIDKSQYISAIVVDLPIVDLLKIAKQF